MKLAKFVTLGVFAVFVSLVSACVSESEESAERATSQALSTLEESAAEATPAAEGGDPNFRIVCSTGNDGVQCCCIYDGDTPTSCSCVGGF